MFERSSNHEVTLEATREGMLPRMALKPRSVVNTGMRRQKDEISVDCLDFMKKILHVAWHPQENISAIAATNNLYIFEGRSMNRNTASALSVAPSVDNTTNADICMDTGGSDCMSAVPDAGLGAKVAVEASSQH